MAASTLLQCPDCSRIIRFSSSQTTIISCSSCGSVLWRDKDGSIGRTAQFPLLQKNDIIQPGTTGIWQNKRFNVLGRFRVWLEESVFNYWTIAFDDGAIAYLGDGYGLYSILEPMTVQGSFSYRDLKDTQNGRTVNLHGQQSYVLKKKQQSLKWEIEGELYALSREAYLRIADFSSEDGSHITVFEWGEKELHFFKVQYSSFENLFLSNLREHAYSDKQFNCSQCKATIHVKTFPYAQSCACTNCGACYELRNGMDFARKDFKKPDDTIYLPLGSSGEIDKVKYEVIGYAQKQENTTEKAIWSEYTLFNPQHGFAFLSVYAGHWIFVQEKGDSPVISAASHEEIRYDNEPFHLFNTYTYRLITAAGEFPYNIFDNGKSKAREFISPPEMWIEERNPDEGVTWYYAKHISNKDLEKAFAPPFLPPKTGVGALQPTGFINPFRIVMATLLAILLLCVVHVTINMSKQEKVLLDKNYFFPDSSNTVSIVTEKFTLDKWRSNIAFEIAAGVHNNWFELGATLVNAENGKEYSLEKGVEYYSGYSEGEYWTEGSTSATAYLTHIPAGTYFLQLQGMREAAVTTTVFSSSPSINNFFVRVIYDTPSYRNLIWAIGLLLIWPVIVWFRSYQNEQSRWNNSPYSTYN